MKVRATYWFLIRPISLGRPLVSEKPDAADSEEFGTAMTMSAGAGDSLARIAPIRLRAECTLTP